MARPVLNVGLPVLALACVLAGCQAPQQPLRTEAAAPCPPPGTAAQARTAQVARSFPFFAAAAPGAACPSFEQTGGLSTVSWRLADGGLVSLAEDPRLEWQEHAWDSRTLVAQPMALLQAAERATFGERGCGIDWKSSERLRSDEPPAVSERVYRGTLCNCSAAERLDPSGQVIGLRFRRAC